MVRRRRERQSPLDDLDAVVRPVFLLLSILVVGYAVTHRAQVMAWGGAILAIAAIAGIVWLVLKKRARDAALNWDDDKILFMLKGMSPAEFEREIADMFRRLDYVAETVGGANDGGVDVVARKQGKRYYIQCKKFMTREVTPHDVRDFLGAITNVNDPAEKGYFITTSAFTLAAERAAEGNPRIELIDGIRLVEYYKLAHGKRLPPTESVSSIHSVREEPDAPLHSTPTAARPTPATASTSAAGSVASANSNTCPECGGRLIARNGKYGEFLGCSRYPGCRYTQKV